MNNRWAPVVLALWAGTTFPVPSAFAAEQTPSNSLEQAEAKYTQAIEGRTSDILAVLSLTNTASSSRVHDIVIAQYRALRAWHDAHDATLKQLSKQTGTAKNEDTERANEKSTEIKASLKKLHEQFIGQLSGELNPQQVEKVKDKMTYNKVQVTYDAYCEIVPNLTEEEKTRMLALLKEAREEAMDCGSAEEKSAVFNRYKGKINNYLSARGHDVGKAFKDWGRRQKTKGDAPPGT